MADGYDLSDLNSDLAKLQQAIGRWSQAVRASRIQAQWANGTVRDAATLRGRIERFHADAQSRAADLQRTVIAEVFAGLVQATPVGNKALWARNLGKPASQHQPKNYVGGRARKGWTIRVAGALPGDPVGSISRVVAGQSAAIVNAVPYMEKLNQGHSRQAPAGFIDSVIARVLAKYPDRRTP